MVFIKTHIVRSKMNLYKLKIYFNIEAGRFYTIINDTLEEFTGLTLDGLYTELDRPKYSVRYGTEQFASSVTEGVILKLILIRQKINTSVDEYKILESSNEDGKYKTGSIIPLYDDFITGTATYNCYMEEKLKHLKKIEQNKKCLMASI